MCVPAWEEIAKGARTAEIAKDDLGIRAGDVVVLKEIGTDWVFTNRVCSRRVTHVLRGGQTGPMGCPGLAAGYVMLSLAPSPSGYILAGRDGGPRLMVDWNGEVHRDLAAGREDLSACHAAGYTDFRLYAMFEVEFPDG